MSDLEYCTNCDEPTGNAGIHDGSLYTKEMKGPFCDRCFAYENRIEAQDKQKAEMSKLLNIAERPICDGSGFYTPLGSNEDVECHWCDERNALTLNEPPKEPDNTPESEEQDNG